MAYPRTRLELACPGQNLRVETPIERSEAPRVIVAGLGKQEKFTIDQVRNIAAAAARQARRLRCETLATITHGAGIAGLDAEACGQKDCRC